MTQWAGEHELIALAQRNEQRGEFRAADDWYTAAASDDNDDFDAMVAAAAFFERRANPAEAQYWYDIAAQAGHPDAIAALDRIRQAPAARPGDGGAADNTIQLLTACDNSWSIALPSRSASSTTARAADAERREGRPEVCRR